MRKDRQTIVMLGDADNGKSTFIARMLLDSESLPLDRISEYQRSAAAFGPALALTQLCDQLSIEQETESTVGLSRFYFQLKAGTNTMIVDIPGQATKSLQAVSGICESTIGVAVIDASRPITLQTLRHLRLAFMFRVPQVIAVVNKMDLVNWDVKTYLNICGVIEALTAKYKLKNVPIFPISSLTGEGLTSQVKQCGWKHTTLYQELLQLIESNPEDESPCLMVAAIGHYKQGIWGHAIATGLFPSDATLYTPTGGSCRVLLQTPKVSSESLRLVIGHNLSMQHQSGHYPDVGEILTSIRDSTFQVYRLVVEVFSENLNIPESGRVSFAWQNANFKIISKIPDEFDPYFVILHLELDAPLSLDRTGFIARMYPIVLYDQEVAFGAGTICQQ